MIVAPLLFLAALQGKDLAVSRLEGGGALSDPPLAFAGPSEGWGERARAHASRDREAIARLRPPSAAEDLFAYVLFGDSPNGHDPLRQTRVSATFDEREKTVRITVSQDRSIPLRGTKDMQYVGFSVALGKLPAGSYAVSVSGAYATRDGERKVASDFHVTVAEAKK